MPIPDFTPFHPGYGKSVRNKKEAERRKTLFRNLRSLAGCGTALPSQEGQHAFRRSTTALSKGIQSSLRRSSGQASWIRAPNAADVPPALYPVAASTSRAGHSAGRVMPEPPESKGDEPLPAGTALAPPDRVTARRPCK
jgi:hypothetical protein